MVDRAGSKETLVTSNKFIDRDFSDEMRLVDLASKLQSGAATSDEIQQAADSLSYTAGQRLGLEYRVMELEEKLAALEAEHDETLAWITKQLQPDALIGPLTAEEWCSLRAGYDDDPLICCANTSDFRDTLFAILRAGGGREWGFIFRDAWERLMASHDVPDEPLLNRMREYYAARED